MFPSRSRPAASESVSNEELEDQIVDLAARIAAATCRWLELVAEFDRRGAHEAHGFHCCATWLAWRCSIAGRSAREYLRVARELGELPLIHDAFSRGELSYSKVRVLTRVATPELEEDLVELARHATAAQLERVARAYTRVLNAADAEAAHERRYLAYEWEIDGSLSIRGSLSAEDGALLLRALEVGREAVREMNAPPGQASASAGPGGSAEPLSTESRSANPPSAEPPASEPGPGDPDWRPAPAQLSAARAPVNADALVLMAETLLANGVRTRAGGERAQVVVHVDAGVLAEAHEAKRSDRCELEDGSPICAETARRLACDTSRVEMLDGPGGPLSVGRKARTVPPATRRALRARDGGCRFPGCTHRRWTDGHHIVHWADGGETSLENTVQLCRRHHRLVHEGGFRVDRDQAGEIRFWTPDGTLLERSPALRSRARRPDRARDAEHGGRRRREPLQPAAGVPVPLSAGGPMDLDLTVSALVSLAPECPRGP
jgi:hypothetical protein